MDMEINKKFLDIIMKPHYKPLKEICMLVRGQPYIVRIPDNGKPINILRELANTKIRYKFDHPSPVKQGRPLKYNYNNKQEALRCYYEARKSKLLKACA